MSNNKFSQRDFQIVKILQEFDNEFDQFSRKSTKSINLLLNKNNKDNIAIKKYESNSDSVKAIGYKTIFGFQKNCFIKHKNRCVVFCNYKNSKRNGQGYVLYHNGLVFKGKFKNDIKIEGIVFNSANFNVVYSGEWQNDTYHGKGILISKNNDQYEGEFQNGQFSGYGKQTWGNGDQYFGHFLNSMKNGQGKLLLQSGDSYEGEFKDNKFNGQGIYKWSNGEYYEGEFTNGHLNGQGKFIHLEGIIAEGRWNMQTEEDVNYRIEDYNNSQLQSLSSQNTQLQNFINQSFKYIHLLTLQTSFQISSIYNRQLISYQHI